MLWMPDISRPSSRVNAGTQISLVLVSCMSLLYDGSGVAVVSLGMIAVCAWCLVGYRCSVRLRSCLLVVCVRSVRRGTWFGDSLLRVGVVG